MEPSKLAKYAAVRGDIDTREILAEQIQKGMGLPECPFVMVLYETIEKLFPSPDPHPYHFNRLPDQDALREWSDAHGWTVDYLSDEHVSGGDRGKLRPLVFTQKH